MKRKDKQFMANMAEEDRKAWVKSIIKRMMLMWDAKEMKDLAPYLGCHERMPSNWITRGSVPWEVVYMCHRQTGASLDWLYNGKAPMLEVSEEKQDQFRAEMKSLLLAWKRLGFVKENGSDNVEKFASTIVQETCQFFDFKKVDDTDK